MKVDRVIRDGETIKLGGVKLKTVLMPGHTRGSTAWSYSVNDSGKVQRTFPQQHERAGFQVRREYRVPEIIEVALKRRSRS